MGALSLQAGHTVGSPVTCGLWGWCCSPCSTASSPSTTAYLRSSSAKSRLPSTPSPSEYSLPFLPAHGGLMSQLQLEGLPSAPKGHSSSDNRRCAGSRSRAGTACGKVRQAQSSGGSCSSWLLSLLACAPSMSILPHCAQPRLTPCCLSQGWPGLRKHCVLDPETAGPGPTAAADGF